jgi:hypothetical protein
MAAGCWTVRPFESVWGTTADALKRTAEGVAPRGRDFVIRAECATPEAPMAMYLQLRSQVLDRTSGGDESPGTGDETAPPPVIDACSELGCGQLRHLQT